jgi:hypothetical protein
LRRFALDYQNAGASIRGQMIRNARADDATSNDHNISTMHIVLQSE